MTHQSEINTAQTSVPARRRLLAGAAAVAAGVLAAQTAKPARAADADLLVIGNAGAPSTGPQAATSRSELNRRNPTTRDDAMCVTNDNGDAVHGRSTNGTGVRGEGGNGLLGVT